MSQLIKYFKQGKKKEFQNRAICALQIILTNLNPLVDEQTLTQ